MPVQTKRGHLFVISGPSGVGKGTIVSKLDDMRPDIWVSVSATTRSPREGEREGVNYFFMDRDDFLEKAHHGGFLEWAEYAGNLYGTPTSEIERRLDAGQDVVLEIEVQGAFQVKDKMPDAKLIFIEPPSLDELRRRIVGRGSESEDVIDERMRTADMELQRKMEYDVTIVNDEVDRAIAEIGDYIDSFD